MALPPTIHKAVEPTDATPLETVERLLEPANAASQLTRNMYLTYLLVGLYIGIIVWGTTDEQLLRNEPVALPLLNLGLPLLGFYGAVPWLFVLLHGNLLLQLYLLARKLFRLDEAIQGLETSEEQEEQRLRLFPFLFNQLLMPDDNSRIVRILMKAVVLGTMIVLPVCLLLFAQVQFVRYQSDLITWWQRLAVTADVVLLWVLWPLIVQPKGESGEWRRRAALPLVMNRSGELRVWWIRVAVPLTDRFSGLEAISSFDFAQFADRRRQGLRLTLEARVLWAVTSVFAISCIVVWPLGLEPNWRDDLWQRWRRIELAQNTVLVEEGSASTVAKLSSRNWKDGQGENLLDEIIGLNLKGRNLRYAVLKRTVLTKSDLREADLQGADLFGVQLQGAQLRGAQLQGADLKRARLQGAFLAIAQLQGADLLQAQLQGAVLFEAQLQGAILVGADLQGADLRGAQLQGADLHGAQLQGADLRKAHIAGARTEGADLGKVHITGARTEGAKFAFSDLQALTTDPLTLEKNDEILQSLPASLSQERRESIEAQLEAALSPLPPLHGAIIETSRCPAILT